MNHAVFLSMAASAILVFLSPAAMGWDNPLYPTSDYTLHSDETHDQLIVDEGVVIDLNGHNLTITGALTPSGEVNTANPAIITNSAGGDSAKVSFQLTQAIGSKEFSKIQFGGNLELELVGVKFNEATGFGTRVNTHTGGTVMDHVYTENGSQPRIAKVNGLGTGPLTLKNSSVFRLITESGTLPWPEIVVCSGTNTFYSERTTSFSGRISVADGAAFYIDDLRNGLDDGSTWETATLDVDPRGAFGIRSNSETNKAGKIKITQDIAGVFKIGGDKGAQFRFNGTGSNNDGVWNVGAIASFDDETAPVNHKWIRVAGVNAHVVVGSANVDSTYWGSFTRETATGHDWSFTKIGSGTWTVGGTNNTYGGTTTIREGAIRLTKEGTLGKNGGIAFDGGALIYADQPDNDPSSRFTAANGRPVILGVDADKDVMFSSDVPGLDTGFVKIGEGRLAYTNYLVNLPPTIAVSNGILHASVKFNPSNTFDVAAGSVMELRAGTRELSGATVIGEGTLRLVKQAGQNYGFRLKSNDFTRFSGTVEIAGAEARSGAEGIVSGSGDNSLDNVTLLVSGMPDENAKLFWFEKSVDLGAIQIVGEHAQIHVANTPTITFGAKPGSESILNGQFVNAACRLVKNGSDSTLTVGPGFSAESGSTLSVNAGRLALASGMTYADLSAAVSLTVANGVAYAGEGVFGAVDLSVHDVVVPDASTFSDKTKTYPLLTAASFSGMSANVATLLDTLNARERNGVWTASFVHNGNGTVTLTIRYLPSGMVLILR